MGISGTTCSATRSPLGRWTKMRMRRSVETFVTLPVTRSGIGSPRGSVQGRTGTPQLRPSRADWTEAVVSSVLTDESVLFRCSGAILQTPESSAQIVR